MVFLSGAFALACATALMVPSSAVPAFGVLGDTNATGVTYIYLGDDGWGNNNDVVHAYYTEGAREVIGVKGQQYACFLNSTPDFLDFTFIGRVSFQIIKKNNQTVWIGPYGNEPEKFATPPSCDYMNATDFEYTDITNLSFFSDPVRPIGIGQDGRPFGLGSVGPFNGVGKAVHGSGGANTSGGSGNTSGGAGSTKKHSTKTILLATLLPLLCLSCIAAVVLSVYLMRRRRDAGGNGTADEPEGDDSGASDGGHQPLNYGGAEGGDDQEKHRAELERMEAEHAERVRLLKAQAEVSS